MRDSVRAPVAVALSLVSIVFWYPVARVGEHFAFGEVNPAAVVASNRIALYWRTGIVVALAVALAPVFYDLTRRPAAVLARLPWLIGVACAALALQAVFVP